jgi:hypothetical protein
MCPRQFVALSVLILVWYTPDILVRCRLAFRCLFACVCVCVCVCLCVAVWHDLQRMFCICESVLQFVLSSIVVAAFGLSVTCVYRAAPRRLTQAEVAVGDWCDVCTFISHRESVRFGRKQVRVGFDIVLCGAFFFGTRSPRPDKHCVIPQNICVLILFPSATPCNGFGSELHPLCGSVPLVLWGITLTVH